jgi:hypothetical protein
MLGIRIRFKALLASLIWAHMVEHGVKTRRHGGNGNRIPEMLFCTMICDLRIPQSILQNACILNAGLACSSAVINSLSDLV